MEEKRKILIVDDDAFLLDMYAFKFSQNNFEVFTAANGAQAIEKLKGGLVPAIILMDIIMPEMDGFEMLEKINNDKLSPDSLKIVLSNKPSAMSKKIVEGLGISKHFAAVYGGDSFPVRKPDPECWKLATAGASKPVMIGDSGTDVQTAKNGGATAIAVTYGYFKPGELDAADHRIDRFAQLLDLLR
jgi:phosphoglycolate phosphatase-like HAD superfamily hydrolase